MPTSLYISNEMRIFFFIEISFFVKNPNLGPFSYETESYLTVSQPDGERLR